MPPQAQPGVNRRYAAFAAVSLTAIWLWVAFDRPYHIPIRTPWNIYTNEPYIPSTLDPFDFPPVDSEAIRKICHNTKWDENLVFTCENSIGGVGNMRNSILHCVRYAISAGAGLLMPHIIFRNPSDIAHIFTNMRTTMDFMFDPQHFKDSLKLSCPSLRIYDSLVELKEDHLIASQPVPLSPKTLIQYWPVLGVPYPEEWRLAFTDWLKKNRPADAKGMFIVDLGRSYMEYPVYSDGESFVVAFGDILKFRSDTRILAAKTLQHMAEIYSFNNDLTQPFLKNSFFGAHLRTEIDAQKAWKGEGWEFGLFETQSNLYLQQAPRSNPVVIYVASGDLEEVKRLSLDAATQDFNVTTKFEHLDEPERQELQNMAWDQQAIVDFMVLLKASDFAGIAHSSFAWNVALKRHVHSKKRDLFNRPLPLSDELSTIYGDTKELDYAACMWP